MSRALCATPGAGAPASPPRLRTLDLHARRGAGLEGLGLARQVVGSGLLVDAGIFNGALERGGLLAGVGSLGAGRLRRIQGGGQAPR